MGVKLNPRTPSRDGQVERTTGSDDSSELGKRFRCPVRVQRVAVTPKADVLHDVE